jgi:hypothetical protein
VEPQQPTNFEKLQQAELVVMDYQFTQDEIDHINAWSQVVIDELVEHAEPIRAGLWGNFPMHGLVF